MHKIIDNVFRPDQVRAAAAAWPGSSAPWLRYDSPLERKQTLNDWAHIPRSIAHLFCLMASLRPAQDLGLGECWLIPDLALYGAGLHQHGRGEHLSLHLDSDRHRYLGLERRINGILFLNDDWPQEWAGAFELHERGTCLHVYPRFNRLLLFAAGDDSLHGVPQPLACPDGELRKTLALYWWGWPSPQHAHAKRPRAQFLAGDDDPATQALARARGTFP